MLQSITEYYRVFLGHLFRPVFGLVSFDLTFSRYNETEARSPKLIIFSESWVIVDFDCFKQFLYVSMHCIVCHRYTWVGSQHLFRQSKTTLKIEPSLHLNFNNIWDCVLPELPLFSGEGTLKRRTRRKLNKVNYATWITWHFWSKDCQKDIKVSALS